MGILVSICLSTYQRPQLLENTLKSIQRQRLPFGCEVIVVDDDPNGSARLVCEQFNSVQYQHISRPAGYRNPAIARNAAYRQASGRIIIAQSDDVIHYSPNCIEELVHTLRPNTFVIATVVNTNQDGQVCCDPTGVGFGDRLSVYTSSQRRRPLFFLGCLWKDDLYAVGGNDEEFTAPSGEDRWFALCLTNGLKLTPIYSEDIVGRHQMHPHCDPATTVPSQNLLQRKTALARAGKIPWQASGGSWL